MKAKISILLIAALALFSCNNEKSSNTPQPESEEDKIVNELMAQCQNFDAEDIIQGLPGEWKYDSQLLYDKSWKNILETYIFFGKYYIYAGGSSAPKFSFTADGKGEYHFTYPYPPYEEDFLSFDWNFDATDNKLVLSGGYNKSAIVSGFNNVYLILDYVNNKNQNIREILKKRVE
ncbi:MAG: hypothetical protein E7129_02710 [Rikenellaceae bacterium]|nr:hypothetical protein [Rikenellaceae bacterium]